MVKNPSEQEDKNKLTKTTRGRHPMPAILRVPCTLLFLFVVSIFFTWFIIWRTNLCDGDAAWKFTQEKPVLTTYSFLVIFALLTAITAVTWRPFLTTGIFFCAISIITFAHIQKYQLRSEPLLPEEFALLDNAGNLMQFVDAEAMTRLVLGVVFVLAGSIITEYYVRKLIGRDLKPLPWWDRHALVPRATFSMLALALLSGIAGPVLKREHTSWLEDINLIAWNQTENYAHNGFIIAFLYNLGNAELEPPATYNEARMAQIAQKYRDLKEADDSERVAWNEKIDNLVIILGETFYDPALLTKYYDHYGGDVTPNLHAIFQDHPSGYMYSPVYGGNTANVEFEIQTGLSNFWANTFPYVNSISKQSSVLSAASWSKEYGFYAQGIHSYDGSMYKRKIVYPKLGYDVFIDENTMQFTDKDGDSGVINDQSIYREILAMIEDTEQSQVIGAVTMQNHAPYAQANYPELEFPLRNRRDDWFAIESSFQSLHKADEYLGEFIDALDEIDERTVVLWFGDHAMGALDAYARSEDKTDRDIAHLTPYFIYTNFEIENPHTTSEVAKANAKLGVKINNVKGIDLPIMTPNCLLNEVFDLLGLEKPPLFYLVENVCSEMPVLALPYQDGEPLKTSVVLNEYELVNYDVINGKHYWDGK